MRRLIFILPLILLVAFPDTASARWSCWRSLGAIERRLVVELSKSDHVHGEPHRVSAAAVVIADQEVPQKLARAGVAFEEIPPKTRRTRKMRSGLEWLLEDGIVQLTPPGSQAPSRLLKVLSARPDPSVTSPLEPAIHHAHFNELLATLKRLNVDLLVDTGLGETKLLGALMKYGEGPNGDYLVISENIPFHVLAHEVDHAEYSAYGIWHFANAALTRLEEGMTENQIFEELANEGEYLKYGEKRLRKVIHYLKTGVPLRDLDEVMAVNTQLELLESQKSECKDPAAWQRWHKEVSDYGKKHILQSLLETRWRLGRKPGSTVYRPLTRAQRHLMVECLEQLGIATNPRFRETELPELAAQYTRRVQGAPPIWRSCFAYGGAAMHSTKAAVGGSLKALLEWLTSSP